MTHQSSIQNHSAQMGLGAAKRNHYQRNVDETGLIFPVRLSPEKILVFELSVNNVCVQEIKEYT